MTCKTDIITKVSSQTICTIISNLQDLTKSRKVSAKKKKKDGHDEGLQEKELDEQLRQPGLQEYRAKRSPAVKGFLAMQGGTPTSNKLPSLVQNRFLSFHVHRLAQKMKKNLSREPLRNGFFEELVKRYGDMLGSTRSLPYKSARSASRRWLENFCNEDNLHIYEPPQSAQVPCRLLHTRKSVVRNSMFEEATVYKTDVALEAPVVRRDVMFEATVDRRDGVFEVPVT